MVETSLVKYVRQTISSLGQVLTILGMLVIVLATITTSPPAFSVQVGILITVFGILFIVAPLKTSKEFSIKWMKQYRLETALFVGASTATFGFLLYFLCGFLLQFPPDWLPEAIKQMIQYVKEVSWFIGFFVPIVAVPAFHSFLTKPQAEIQKTFVDAISWGCISLIVFFAILYFQVIGFWPVIVFIIVGGGLIGLLEGRNIRELPLFVSVMFATFIFLLMLFLFTIISVGMIAPLVPQISI